MDPVVAEKCLKERAKIRSLIEEAGLGVHIENVIGGLFLFVPENEQGGAFVQCFTVASIETQQTSPNFLRLTIANQPSGAIEPRCLVYDDRNKHWHMFYQHQVEPNMTDRVVAESRGGQGHRGFLMAL